MAAEMYQGDCLEIMKGIPDESVDLVLTDPPYGTTACKWDSIIDLDLMWEQLKRIVKNNGAIVLFGMEPFSSVLRCSNLKMYKYDWIWEKSHATGFLNAWKQPLRNYEAVSVFYKKQVNYNPQIKDKEISNIRPLSNQTKKTENYGDYKLGKEYRKLPPDKTMPKSIIKFNSMNNASGKQHPTQKPVALMEYLIKTYANKGETVLDFTMGSGTTGVAAKQNGRNFIGIEKDPEYFKIAQRRIKSAEHQLTF